MSSPPLGRQFPAVEFQDSDFPGPFSRDRSVVVPRREEESTGAENEEKENFGEGSNGKDADAHVDPTGGAQGVKRNYGDGDMAREPTRKSARLMTSLPTTTSPTTTLVRADIQHGPHEDASKVNDAAHTHDVALYDGNNDQANKVHDENNHASTAHGASQHAP